MRAALVALMFFYYSRGGNSFPVPLSHSVTANSSPVNTPQSLRTANCSPVLGELSRSD